MPIKASNKVPYRVPRHWKPDGSKTVMLTPEEALKCKQIERTIKGIERREHRLLRRSQ